MPNSGIAKSGFWKGNTRVRFSQNASNPRCSPAARRAKTGQELCEICESQGSDGHCRANPCGPKRESWVGS